MKNSNAYDDFHNSRKIKEDYTEVIEYLNKTVFKEEEITIEEWLFNTGNVYCEDLPEFYPHCQCFWDAYIDFYYQGVKYYLETHSIKSGGSRYKKIKELTKNINNMFDIKMDLRQNIFIEHQSRIDANLTAKKKNGSKSINNKRSDLKSI